MNATSTNMIVLRISAPPLSRRRMRGDAELTSTWPVNRRDTPKRFTGRKKIETLVGRQDDPPHPVVTGVSDVEHTDRREDHPRRLEQSGLRRGTTVAREPGFARPDDGR